MATYCDKVEAEPAAIKAYIDGLTLTTHNIIAVAITGQKAIVFVDGT
jgi:hypothetical protein